MASEKKILCVAAVVAPARTFSTAGQPGSREARRECLSLHARRRSGGTAKGRAACRRLPGHPPRRRRRRRTPAQCTRKAGRTGASGSRGVHGPVSLCVRRGHEDRGRVDRFPLPQWKDRSFARHGVDPDGPPTGERHEIASPRDRDDIALGEGDGVGPIRSRGEKIGMVVQPPLGIAEYHSKFHLAVRADAQCSTRGGCAVPSAQASPSDSDER